MVFIPHHDRNPLPLQTHFMLEIHTPLQTHFILDKAMSHAELDAPELDTGNPAELGLEYAQLKTRLRHLNVMGGCCGTDHRHIEQIASACLSLSRATT